MRSEETSRCGVENRFVNASRRNTGTSVNLALLGGGYLSVSPSGLGDVGLQTLTTN